MQKTLSSAFLSATLLCGACNSSDSNSKPAAQEAVTPAAPTEIQSQVASPQVGDVYVVQFQPQNVPEMRYFFYHLYRVTPDSAYLHPARKEATDPNADLTQPDFQASDNTIAYTRRELADLLKLQPGDALKSQLIRVRRPE